MAMNAKSMEKNVEGMKEGRVGRKRLDEKMAETHVHVHHHHYHTGMKEGAMKDGGMKEGRMGRKK